jgi:hypothetical protein
MYMCVHTGLDVVAFDRLPAYVKLSIDVLFTAKYAVSRRLVQYISRAPMAHSSFNQLETAINQLRYDKFIRTQEQYYAHVLSYMDSRRTSMTRHFTTSGLGAFQQFPTDYYSLDGYNGSNSPSHGFLSDIYVHCTQSHMEAFRRHMTGLHSNKIAIDHHFKVYTL